MSLYAEYMPRWRFKAAHLSDKLPWRMLAAPGVMVHKQTNCLQRSYQIRGHELAHLTK